MRAAPVRHKPLVLLADDLGSARDLLATELEEAGCQVVQVVDGLDAWEKFQLYPFDLVITDLRMPRSDGMELLRRIGSAYSPYPRVPVLLVSAYGDLSVAAEAGRAGAVDFFPFNESGIEDLVERAVEILKRAEPSLPLPLLGGSLEAGRLREQAEAFARLDSLVLLCGPPGSGRESIARYLHRRSRHSALPFVVVDASGAISMLSRLLEGTAYLEDFEHFGREEQERWLARGREADALGASARVRILAALREPPEGLVADGALSRETSRFLARFRIDVPSLSRRQDDLRAIIAELHRGIQRRMGKGATRYEGSALDALTAHRWESLGELESTLECVVAFAHEGRVTRQLVVRALAELEAPLDRIDQERRRAERRQLIELYRKHGTYAGVARELGITRNAAKYRLARHDLLARCRPTDRSRRGSS